MSYCQSVRSGRLDPLHAQYHDERYGFATNDDRELFARLSLEVFQAGLSWTLILKKEAALRSAFAGFDVDAVAGFGDADRARLLADASIIRNRRKIDATIENARRIARLRDEHGSFGQWLDARSSELSGDDPLDPTGWTSLFRRTFVFTGGEVTRVFLLCTGYLPGAHDADCAAHDRALQHNRQVRDREERRRGGKGVHRADVSPGRSSTRAR